VSEAPPKEIPVSYEIIVQYAYHGTDMKSANSIIAGNFKPSGVTDKMGKETLLGRGVYFYENCRDYALKWTQEWVHARGLPNPVLIRCTVALGKCIDFLDPSWGEQAKELYDGLRMKYASKKGTEYMVERLTQPTIVNMLAQNTNADTIRWLHHRDKPLFPGSNIFVDSRVIICVRNTGKISNPTLEAMPPAA
jgi:hypothetical protein